ncbi:transcription factor bHLH167 [Malania oleifera]|uniref:transcription factor bHLH167 n=1 Tax=Malania oleifera TaxID=397392 RepID=UPI0025AEC11F|nr:transcription factor bHLH167 [Malania oleifera]
MRRGSNAGASSSKLDRNVIERNRRMHMKDLYSRLASILPAQSSKEKLALHVLLDQATGYIKQLQQKAEELRRRRDGLKGDGGQPENSPLRGSMRLPVVKLRDLGSALEVNLVIGPNQNFMIHQVIRILEQEGAEVVTTSCSIVGGTVFYTIYSQPLCPRIGIESSRAHERLKQLILT